MWSRGHLVSDCCPLGPNFVHFRISRTLLGPPLILIRSAVGTFLFGYDSGIISSVISTNYTHFQDYFGSMQADGTRAVSPGISGAIVSVFAGGAFCKSLSLRRAHCHR